MSNNNNINYSKFIASDNQTLLWKTLNKSHLFNLLPENERPEWFKNMIGHIYFERNMYFFDTDDLTTLNKKTIRIMLNERITGANKSQIVDEGWGRRGNLGFPTDDRIFVNEMKENKIEENGILKKELSEQNAMLFDMRQREFNDLIANSKPPQIDFRIKEIDEPIEDMDMLIEKCMKERNDYTPSFTPFSMKE
jgi:hypothetical protein